MTLIPNALSPSVQKTVTVTLTGSAVGTTVEEWCAHLQVSTILLRHFVVIFCLLVKTRLRVKQCHMKMRSVYGFNILQTNSILYEMFCKRTRFETEAQDNEEGVN